jgi:trans-2,3-dihydro-3-hydroxyanthranilate isomerase
MMARRFRFDWLDVFASRPLEGNPLAVFPDARGLSDDEMQAIARETHLSETTFVFPEGDATDLKEGFRTRIFAVMGEMPFAGHPTLGTANVLSLAHQRPEISLRLEVGRIPVTFTERDGHRFGEMVQNDPKIGQTHDPRAVAKALRIDPKELDASAPIETVSTGVPFGIVPFASLETLTRLRPDWASLEEYLTRTDAQFLYLVCRQTVDPAAGLHSRMIFSGGEDPATGSAAGPAVGWMVRHGWARAGQSVVIEQGLEIHRRSHIYARADLRDKLPVQVRVGGYCAPVIHGELAL